MIAIAVAAALEVHTRAINYGLLAGGAAIGGFFSGRASPHRSFLEPAIAGVLVVGSLVLFLWQTSVGTMLLPREQVLRAAPVIGGIVFAGGLGGAIFGELSAPDMVSHSRLRWMGMTWLITAGALLAALIVTHVLLVDSALRAGGAFKLWQSGELITADQLGRAILLAMAAAAAIGGFVTQAAAPDRMLLSVAAAVLVGYAAALAALSYYVGPIDRVALQGIATLAGGGGVLAFVGAFFGWILDRLTE